MCLCARVATCPAHPAAPGPGPGVVAVALQVTGAQVGPDGAPPAAEVRVAALVMEIARARRSTADVSTCVGPALAAVEARLADVRLPCGRAA